VILRTPLPYDQFVACLQRSHFVISDSGGVQEEATALGKPVLVLRNETERPEGIRAGALKLVGTDERRIAIEGQRLLDDAAAYRRMSRASNVFGDGKAAGRIVRILEQALA
jgi:UDP-N-acetylglucosamine 2-epimerase (non-hydrolysing)